MKGTTLLQGILAVMVIPISILVLMVGMVIVPIYTPNKWPLFVHMFKKLKAFMPQLMVAFWRVWNHRDSDYAQQQMSLSMMLVISVVGLPLIAMLLFVEEFT